ncbi:MAG: hypothetical protein IK142_00680 [Clostridiales bacterium]|nr:hypothetical protein [Clostridiales bacterium]
MKKKTITVFITIVVLLIGLAPCPLKTSKDADGGTRHYSPILPLYTIIDWNRVQITPLNDNNSTDRLTGTTTKGIQIFVLGRCVYDGRYTAEGAYAR